MSLLGDDLHESLIELYLNVKVRSNDEITKYDHDMFDQEKDKLRQIEPSTIIEYIRSSVEILMNLKQEEFEANKKGRKKAKSKPQKLIDDSCELLSMTSQSLCSTLEKFKDGPPQEYEEAIQKLEGDVRMHIRVEQQMRLHIENLQQKIEDLGRENGSQRISDLAKIKHQHLEDSKKHDEQVKDLIDKFQNKIQIMENKYEKRVSELLKQVHKTRSSSQKDPNYNVTSKSAKNFKNNMTSSQTNFSYAAEQNISYNDNEEDTDATPADELNSNDRRQVDDKMTNDSVLLNFYKKIEEKRAEDFKIKQNAFQLHEQAKSSKGHHHTKSSYNFDQHSKYYSDNYYQ
jgi:hypothetical protein